MDPWFTWIRSTCVFPTREQRFIFAGRFRLGVYACRAPFLAFSHLDQLQIIKCGIRTLLSMSNQLCLERAASWKTMRSLRVGLTVSWRSSTSSTAVTALSSGECTCS